jgi:CBS domain-containing protein
LTAAAYTPVTEIMTRDVVFARRDVSVEEMTRLLLERGLHGAPVVDQAGALIGFISITDLLRDRYERGDTDDTERPLAMARGTAGYDLGAGFHVEELARATVGDLMMPFTISVASRAPITMAAALMSIEGVHRVPVVSPSGAVVGIVSALDILRFLAEADGYRAAPGVQHHQREHAPADGATARPSRVASS